jgi:hypothetical protein
MIDRLEITGGTLRNKVYAPDMGYKMTGWDLVSHR